MIRTISFVILVVALLSGCDKKPPRQGPKPYSPEWKLARGESLASWDLRYFQAKEAKAREAWFKAHLNSDHPFPEKP